MIEESLEQPRGDELKPVESVAAGDVTVISEKVDGGEEVKMTLSVQEPDPDKPAQPAKPPLRRLLHVGLPFAPIGETAVTVRRGFKWADGKTGEKLELVRCDQAHDGPCNLVERNEWGCHIEGTGEVKGKWIGTFKTIPGKLIEMNHDRSSRAYSSLLKIMQVIYQGFNDGDYVTALIYRRLP